MEAFRILGESKGLCMEPLIVVSPCTEDFGWAVIGSHNWVAITRTKKPQEIASFVDLSIFETKPALDDLTVSVVRSHESSEDSVVEGEADGQENDGYDDHINRIHCYPFVTCLLRFDNPSGGISVRAAPCFAIRILACESASSVARLEPVFRTFPTVL